MAKDGFLVSVKVMGLCVALACLILISPSTTPFQLLAQPNYPTIQQHDQLATQVAIDDSHIVSLEQQIAKEQAGHEAVLAKLDEVNNRMSVLQGIFIGVSGFIGLLQDVSLLSLGQKRAQYRSSDKG